MDCILKYFPQLTAGQQEQFSALYGLYDEWNSKINVISRKDIQNLYVHHVLHSLSIAKIIRFNKGTTILDVGTGGGFPGIPLAIFFPDCRFVLLDSIGKKIKVATEVSQAVGLKNVEFRHCRIEDEKGKYDFVVNRAVMPLSDLTKIVQKNISVRQQNSLPNGIICLKGGNLENEIQPFRQKVEIDELNSFFEEAFFETKKLVYLPVVGTGK
ncbi:MAG: 16S rRNA (guanine(527)-N(7))-methyltransferase RsmG [Prevotella sp.]|nr:16S rRNA (guanine(527)-N(7))-methyltransferase RsmG [Prevotella sp.]